MLYVFIWSKMGQFWLLFCLLAKIILNVGLLKILLYLISASAGWRLEWLWNFIPMSVSYIFCKVPTNICLLVNVRNFKLSVPKLILQNHLKSSKAIDYEKSNYKTGTLSLTSQKPAGKLILVSGVYTTHRKNSITPKDEF